MKEGFLVGCRPLIGLDGCFIKTVHGGQLLTVVGKDGNDNLYPIVIGYVKSENTPTWTWFLQTLLEDIVGLNEDKWTFISDRQKNLVDVLHAVAPESEHRYCLRHLYQNFSVKWKGQDLKHLFWKTTSVGNQDEWKDDMKKIELADPKIEEKQVTAYEWLMALPKNCWARPFFKNKYKFDVLVNNLCKSFNNMILPARDLPLVSMFEWIRSRLMTRLQIKREGMEKFDGQVCLNIMKKVNKQLSLTRDYYTKWAGRSEFEVSRGDEQYVVKLDKRACTCGMFQLNGYPCCHAASAIGDRRQKIEDYIHECYKKEAYLRAYQFMIHVAPRRKHYIQTPYESLKAPTYKVKMGRPKKKRRKCADEAQGQGLRKRLTHTYSRCFGVGHNVKSCKNPPHPRSKFYTDGPSQQQTGRSGQNIRRRRQAQGQSGRRRSRTTPRSASTPSVVQTPVPRPSPAATAKPLPTPPVRSSPAATASTTAAPVCTSSFQAAHAAKKKWARKATDYEVLQNIRARSRDKRNPVPWKP